MAREATPQDIQRFRVIENHRKKADNIREDWNDLRDMYLTRYYAREREREGVAIAPERLGGESRDAATRAGVDVENNWLYAFTDTQVANIVPPNPAVDVTARRVEYDDAAQNRETVVNDLFYRDKFHAKLWKLSSLGAVLPRAFTKVAWSAAKGRPIVRVLSPEYVFYDVLAEDWDDVRYVIEVTVMTVGQFKSKVKGRGKRSSAIRRIYRSDAAEHATLSSYPAWLRDKKKTGGDVSDADIVMDNFQWVVVYEYFDFVARKHLHYVEGDNVPIYEGPLPYPTTGNPYTMLVFNDNLRDLGGVSDGELARPTIERLNEMSTLEMIHTKTTIPALLLQAGLVDDPEAFLNSLLTVAGPGEAIQIEGKANAPIQNIVGVTPTPNLPVNWAQTTESLRSLVNFVLGMSDYQRGAVGGADIATEVQVADTATRTRNERRRKVLYDHVAVVARKIIGLYSDFMPEDMVIPVRVGSSQEARLVSREDMRFTTAEDASFFDYAMRPYSAQEQNSVTQLKLLLQLLPFYTTSPHIDQRALAEKFTVITHMPELLLSAEEARKQQEQQAMAGGGGGGEGGEGGDAGDESGGLPGMGDAGGGGDGLGVPGGPDVQGMTGGDLGLSGIMTGGPGGGRDVV